MCGRYTNTQSADQIVGALGLAGAPDPETVGRFNVAPTQEVLAAVARAARSRRGPCAGG